MRRGRPRILPRAKIRRHRGRAVLTGPPVLVTNIAVPSLPARKRSVYFLPDRILVRDGRHYADMPYSSCRITGTATRFIEEGSVPRDAERVGITWKYVNKGGRPDRRYKNNPQLPIMRYGELTLTAQAGFSFVWQTSRATAAPALSSTLTPSAASHAMTASLGSADRQQPDAHTHSSAVLYAGRGLDWPGGSHAGTGRSVHPCRLVVPEIASMPA